MKHYIHDVENVCRYVVGYEKESGDALKVEYVLDRRASLSFLQKIFDVDSQDDNLTERYMIDCYKISLKQSKLLQPYVKEKLDLEMYDFFLECHSEEGG